MNIFNLEDPRITRIKRDLELTPYDWWLRSMCPRYDALAAGIYFNVNYYHVYHTRGVPLACII